MNYFLGQFPFLVVVVHLLWPSYAGFSFAGINLDPRRLVFLLGALLVVPLFFKCAKMLSRSSGVFIVFLVSLFLWRLISSVFSEEIFSRALLIYDFVYFLAPAVISSLLFGCWANARVLEQAQNRLLWISVVSIFIVSLYGVFEYLIGFNYVFNNLPKIDAGAEFAQMMALDRSRDGFLRAQSTLEHPLIFAEVCAIGVAVCGSMIFFLKNLSALLRIILFASVVACIAGGFVSGARTFYVAFGALIILYGTYWATASKNGFRQIISLFFGFFIILMVVAFGEDFLSWLSFVLGGQSVDQQDSAQAREIIFDRAVNAVQLRPFMGYGVGNALFVAISGTGGLATLDSNLIAMALECGLVGLFLFVFPLVYFIIRPLWVVPVYKLDRCGATALGGVALVCLIFSSVLYMMHVYTILYIIAGAFLAKQVENK